MLPGNTIVGNITKGSVSNMNEQNNTHAKLTEYTSTQKFLLFAISHLTLIWLVTYFACYYRVTLIYYKYPGFLILGFVATILEML